MICKLVISKHWPKPTLKPNNLVSSVIEPTPLSLRGREDTTLPPKVCFFCLQSHAWVIEKNWTLSNKRCFFECDDCQCFSESCGPCATFFKMAVFRKDPCGFTCLIMTYAAVIYADYVVVRWNVFAFYYNKLILEVVLSCSNYKLIIANFKL